MTLSKKEQSARFRTIMENLKKARSYLKLNRASQAAKNALWQAGEDAKEFSHRL